MTCLLAQPYGVGFTGTQEGAHTNLQLDALSRALQAAFVRQGWLLHHGDCVGGDADAHGRALLLGALIALHPPSNPSKRARCRPSLIVFPPRPYLERNHNIVDTSGELVALPRLMAEEQRSGTWATIRYARRCQRPITLCWPDGSCTQENHQ